MIDFYPFSFINNKAWNKASHFLQGETSSQRILYLYLYNYTLTKFYLLLYDIFVWKNINSSTADISYENFKTCALRHVGLVWYLIHSDVYLLHNCSMILKFPNNLVEFGESANLECFWDSAFFIKYERNFPSKKPHSDKTKLKSERIYYFFTGTSKFRYSNFLSKQAHWSKNCF